MILLNFAHPLTEEHQRQLEQLLGQAVERIIEIPTHFDPLKPFGPQVQELADQVPLTSQQWQTVPLLLNPPSLAVIAAVLLAELHGRCGYFPPVLRLRPVAGKVPPQFEVAEIIDLQVQREQARLHRSLQSPD